MIRDAINILVQHSSAGYFGVKLLDQGHVNNQSQQILPNYFPKWLYQITFQLSVNESSHLLTTDIIRGTNHFGRHVVEFCCGCGLDFQL